MDNEKKIAILREQLAACVECPLKEGTKNAVLGEGNVNARIVFVGEAPGRNEDLHGRPFVGAAGKILDQLLEGIGLKRADVFITNIVNHRPPNNRDPKPEEISFYARRFLSPLLDSIDPTIIVTLGRHAMQLFLGDQAQIAQAHGTVQQSTGDLTGKEWPVFSVYHPAAALYNRGLLPTLESDFQILKSLIAR